MTSTFISTGVVSQRPCDIAGDRGLYSRAEWRISGVVVPNSGLQALPIHSLTHSPTHPLTHSLTHSPTHSPSLLSPPTPLLLCPIRGFKGRDFSCSVVEVLRVQNRDLWKEYAFRRRRTAELNDGDPNELLDLKHGTSRTAPGEVYGCRQGLDSRFSETGYYGRGLYLAEEASYVDGGYRHTLDAAARLHQMLLVRASVGTPEQRAGQDRSIKMPVVGRHTVRGPVRGHQQAYVCYELYMAYPEYLITYVSQ